MSQSVFITHKGGFSYESCYPGCKQCTRLQTQVVLLGPQSVPMKLGPLSKKDAIEFIQQQFNCNLATLFLARLEKKWNDTFRTWKMVIAEHDNETTGKCTIIEARLVNRLPGLSFIPHVVQLSVTRVATTC